MKPTDKIKNQNNNKIEEGDIVNVNINNSQFTLCNKAIVLYIPCQQGDCWQFKDLDTGEIHYINEGCTITLKEKGYKEDIHLPF